MKSPVSGVAGAVRIRQLTLAGLTRAEQHGKRLDETGKARAISVEPPVTTTGLDLNELYQTHVERAFVPRAKSKAMHVIIQFPKDLVDGNDADLMLEHAREFGRQVFGNNAIFADRLDRDEKSQHVVDLFVAPRYWKRTRRDGKVAVSMTRHLKALAEKYGQPTIPHGIGRALQDAWFEYLRDNMGLEKVQRGSAKEVAGPDWKSAEQLRAEELAELQAEAKRAREEARRQGYEEGLERGQREAHDLRVQAETNAKAFLDAAEKQSEAIRLAAEEEALANARALTQADIEAAATDKIAARKDRDAAAAERAAAKLAGLADAEKELSARETALARQKVALAEREAGAAEAAAKASALIRGIEAWTAGDIVRAGRTRDGQLGIQWRDEATKHRIKPLILPAWEEVWEAVVSLTRRMAAVAEAIEAEARQKAREVTSAAREAATVFLARLEVATVTERELFSRTASAQAVAAFVSNLPAQTSSEDPESDADFELFRRAAAAGLAKGVRNSALGVNS